MKVLVTGGAGFIGSHLVDAYVSAGHDVVVLDNFSTGDHRNLRPEARVVKGDVRDADLVNGLFELEQFNLVNHHAAQLDVRISVANPAFDAEQNIIGSVNLLQAAVTTGVERFIFASSGGTVYGDQQVFPADETHPTNPISPYGVSKLSVEKYLGYFAYQYGLRFGVLRYTNVYGPRQNSHGEAGVVAIFCTRMLSGEQPIIFGSGEQTRDYVYVGDIARANLMATDYLERHPSGTFNICTNTEVTINQLFQQLNGMVENQFEEVHGEAKPGEQFRSVCAYDKAAAELGWKPEVDLEEGLRRTMESFRK
ncbi:MAG: NAD-dependent epimerase/dehydratase family protein [Ignavibacteriae bacterium]|nr:NAD-dependent epimerase/dehydratase family protein [Ignavibacteriota bacterium]MCB9216745.1 NAD-dependent epimerase/dehydratase family protein [Ignavibacteria bacterium]